MQKEIKFAVEEIKHIEFSDYDEEEYSIARLGFISTKPNSHEIGISEDVLRASAPTALGKWIVADMQFGDATTHTPNEHIVGYVPNDQEIEFIEDEDGYLRAYVDGIISKRYAADFCDIFAKDNNRAVSIEARFEMADDDTATAFDIKGITVLGRTVRPSCPDSDITFVRFSETEADEYYKKVHKFGFDTDGKEEKMEEIKEIEFSAVNIDDMWARIWNVIDERSEWDYYIQGIYEEDNQKFAILCDRAKNLYRLNFSLTEDGLAASDEIVEVKQEFIDTDKVKKFAEPENVADYRFAEGDKKGENPDDEPDDKGDGEEKMSKDEMMKKIDQLSKDIEERDHIIMEKDAELSELRKFKEVTMAKETACAVEAVMAEIKPFITDEQFSAFREEGLSCTGETLDAWSNKVKATCFTEVKKNVKKEDTGVFSFAAPVESKKADKSEDIWTRLRNQH